MIVTNCNWSCHNKLNHLVARMEVAIIFRYPGTNDLWLAYRRVGRTLVQSPHTIQFYIS